MLHLPKVKLGPMMIETHRQQQAPVGRQCHWSKWTPIFCWSLGIVLLALGCQNRKMTLADLHDPLPTVKIRAIKWAGDNQIKEAVGPLIDALGDEDKSVRLFAIGALVRITGSDHGYHYQASPQARAQAIQHWRQRPDALPTPPISEPSDDS